jgi:hypothetical protein
MAKAVIISIISICIVIAVSFIILSKHFQKKKEHYASQDEIINQIVSKTNSTNEYGYEKNKEQDVSLDTVKNDVQTYTRNINEIKKNYDYIKNEQDGLKASLTGNFKNLQDNITKDVSSIQDNNVVQTKRIDGLYSFSEETRGTINDINDQVTVINGRLVNIGKVQQEQINKITNDNDFIKKDNGDLRNVVYNVKNDNVTRMKEVNDNINSYQNKSTTQTNNIDVLKSRADAIQTLINNLTSHVEVVKKSIESYIIANGDMKLYARKDDINSINQNLNNYLTTNDFSSYKTSLPEYVTQVEAKNVYSTKTDLENANKTIIVANKLIDELKISIGQLYANSATKQDVLDLTTNATQSTVNLTSLNKTILSFETNLTNIFNTLNAYKTEVSVTYATQAQLKSNIDALDQQIKALKNGTSLILESLTIQSKLNAKGDITVNDIKISNNWMNYTTTGTDKSEISNDLTTYKSLVIAGNKSGGGDQRRVTLLDKVDVKGTLGVDSGAEAQTFNSRDWIKGKNHVGIINDAAYMNSAGQIRGNSWVAAGANHASWMNSDGQIYANNWIQSKNHLGIDNGAAWMNSAGQIRGNSWVAAGENNASLMNSDGQIYANNWIQSKNHLGIDNGAAWMNSAGIVHANNLIKSPGSIEIENKSAYMREGELYAKNKLKVDGTGELGNLNVKGDAVFDGGNNWIMHTPDDGRRNLYVAPSGTAGKNDWNWGAQTRFDPDGTVNITKLKVNGHIRGNVAENQNIPNGWGGGLHVWDIYANATIAAGQNGNVASYLNSGGDGYMGRNFSVGGYTNLAGGAYVKNGLTIEGDTVMRNNLITPNSHIIHSQGRQHISGEEHLFLLNKTGTTVSKAWGGNANLTVDGNLHTREYTNMMGGAYVGGDLVVQGNMRVVGTSWVKIGSDERIKENIKPISNNKFEEVNKLKPVSYKLKDYKDEGQQYGFIAQDVEKVYPDLVSQNKEGLKNMNYIGVIPLLTGKINQNLPTNDTLCLGDVCINKEQLRKLKTLL